MYSNPHKALYGEAAPRRTKRTVFGGAPCTELCEYRYMARTGGRTSGGVPPADKTGGIV